MSDDSRAYRLPRGPNSLTREEIVASQRGRLLQGLADAAGEKGLAAVTVADILRRARVSRETFYQNFSDKNDCALVALETAAVVLGQAVQLGLQSSTASGLEQFREVIRVYLEGLAAEPAFTRLFLVEVYAAGPDAVARRMWAQDLFVDVVGGVFESAGHSNPRLSYELVVGAVSAIVTKRVAAGATADLTELTEPLVAFAEQVLVTRRKKTARAK